MATVKLISSFGKDWFFHSDSSTLLIRLYENDRKHVTVNGIPLSSNVNIETHGNKDYFSIQSQWKKLNDNNDNDEYIHHIHFPTNYDSTIIQITIQYWIYLDDDDELKESYVYHKDISYNKKRGYTLNDEDTSYELLRTNPRLTGNIKVVVDSDSNLYLDTFKVSNGLSQRKYRKISIDPNEYYGACLMSKMSSIPTDDLYKIENTCSALFSLANDYGEQYYDIYNSGVRTNTDRMYSENYSILAPLCIKRKIPDFFLIFKVKDYENIPTSSEKIKYFLKNGEIVKTFDLRKDTGLGKFIRKIYENSMEYVGDVYIPYDYDQDTVYNGISLDRGVVSKIHEPSCIERQISNQVAMNDWYTSGFERNHIVSKNIVNFEFMFDDLSEDLFSVNTYFGLYVKLNGEESEFSYLGYNTEYPQKSFDGYVSGIRFDPSNYPEVIYGLSTEDDFIRLRHNILSVDSLVILEPYRNKPYKNIASPEYVDISSIIDGSCSMATVTLNTVLDPGEHFRVIDKSLHTIHEVVISNCENENLDISEEGVYTVSISNVDYTIRRITVYNIDYRQNVLGNDNDIEQIRKREIELVVEAFNSFSDSMIDANFNENAFSLIYKADYTDTNNLIIEKVCSFACLDPDYQNRIRLFERYTDDSAYIFNNINDKEEIRLEAESTDDTIKLLYPVGFEATGDRAAYAYEFIPFTNLSVIDENIEQQLSENNTVVYYTGNAYEKISEFKITQIKSNGSTSKKEVWTMPWFTKKGGYIINISIAPKVIDGRIRIYNLYPLNAGICSIFPVKDFNCDIIDTTNRIFNINQSISETGGEFTQTDNIFGTKLLESDEETTMDYIDKVGRSTEYTDIYETRVNLKETSITTSTDRTGYLTNLNNIDQKYSDVPILFPCCCKWKFVGTDTRGENMRVMYQYETNSNNNSYYIPEDTDGYIGNVTISDGNDCSLIGYGQFDNGINRYPKYISSKLDPRTHPTFFDYLFYNNGSMEDILITEEGSHGIPSILYSTGDNSAEFISNGVRIRMDSIPNNTFNISKYNGYAAMLICCAGNNPKRLEPCEILIDEKSHQLLIIIYNGSASFQMAYNKHNAKRTVGGKVYIPLIYPVFHTTSISECENDFGGVKVSDDSSVHHDASVYLTVDNSNGRAVLLSPPYNNNSFIMDKNMTLYGTVDNSTALFNTYKNDIVFQNPSLVIDTTSIPNPISSDFRSNLGNIDEFIDMFIISYGDPDSSDFIVPEDTSVDFATLPLSIVKNIITNANLTIKGEEGINFYGKIKNLMNISIIDPVYFIRENEDFDFLNESNPLSVHPSYAEPLTRDILSFFNKSDIIGMFNMSFEGCNIIVDDVHKLNQLPIKKYSDEKWAPIEKNTSRLKLYDLPLVTFRTKSQDNTGFQIISSTISKNDTINDGEKYYKVLETFGIPQAKNYLSIDGTSADSIYIGDTSVKIRDKIYDASIDKIQDGHYICNISNGDEEAPDVSIDETIMCDSSVGGGRTHSLDSTLLVKSSYKRCKINDDSSISTIVQTYDSSVYTPNATDFIINGNETLHCEVIGKSTTPQLHRTPPILTQSTGIYIKNDTDIITDIWHNDIFCKFDDCVNDIPIVQNGFKTGYEKNVFFASHGISKKTTDDNNNIIDYIEITDWTGNVAVDIKTKNIMFNITDALINYILYSDGYSYNYDHLNIDDPNAKRIYIQNTILPMITIDENCPFELYYKTGSRRISYGVYGTEDGLIKLDNTSNELIFKNNKYYMQVNTLRLAKYFAKMKIYL